MQQMRKVSMTVEEFDSESDDSREAEEISLAEARRPYQISMARLEMTKTAMEMSKSDKCFKLIRILCPHILLFGFALLYICTVAIVYYYIEGNNERMERVKLELAVEMAQRNLMTAMHSLAPNIPIESLQHETNEFSREMIRLGWTRGRLGMPLAAGANGWTGTIGNGTPATGPIWSPANSLLFAMSVVARIGYGHIVPMTSLGKLLLFPLVMFGSCLFLITAADIGKFISDFLNWLYRIYRRSYQSLKQAIKRKRNRQFPSTNNRNNASIKSKSQEGDDKSTPAFSLNFALSEEDNEVEEEEYTRVSLLFLIPLLLLPLWALMALLYFHLEGWAWLDCFYFVFVTFTAVGFGDFAPSSTLSILVTVLLTIPIFGFTTMLFDLAGTEFIRKLHYFGTICEDCLKGFKAIIRRRRKKKRIGNN